MTEAKDVSLQGVIEIQVHTYPDVKARKDTDIGLANRMKKAGARAVVLKSHYLPTVDRAMVVREVTGFEAYGGIVLNETVGGFNPAAVENALKLGAKIIWMPTMDAYNNRVFFGQKGGIKAVIDGKVCAPLIDILRMIAEYDVVLSMGHLSVDEQLVLADKAAEIGVTRIVVDHPEYVVVGMQADIQKKMVNTYHAFMARSGFLADLSRSYDVNAEAIKELGDQSTVLITDAGLTQLPFWDDFMREYIAALINKGISRQAIDTMTKKNPATLLNLE